MIDCVERERRGRVRGKSMSVVVHIVLKVGVKTLFNAMPILITLEVSNLGRSRRSADVFQYMQIGYPANPIPSHPQTMP